MEKQDGQDLMKIANDFQSQSQAILAKAEEEVKAANEKVEKIKTQIQQAQSVICQKDVNIIVPVNATLSIYEEQIERQKKWYKDQLEIPTDEFMSQIEKIHLPDKSPDNLPKLQFVLHSDKTQPDAIWEAISYNKYRENGKTPFSDVLDMNRERISQNVPYALFHYGTQEPPEDYKNKSAQYMWRVKGHITCMQLTERLIADWQFFSETGKHLDVKNITYVVDSVTTQSKCFPAGHVPRLDWDDSKLRVYFNSTGNSNAHLRSRPVSLFFPSNL